MNAIVTVAALMLVSTSAQVSSPSTPSLKQGGVQILFVEHGGALTLNGKNLDATKLRDFAKYHLVYLRAGLLTSYADFTAALSRIQAIPGAQVSLVTEDRTAQ